MKTSPSEQLEKFIKAARDLECDDDEKAFKDRLKGLVRVKPGEKRDKSD